MNIYSKNLNLLLILDALNETGSVTGAATKLKMSQPNLSRALRLLRDEFEDPLFVRTSKGIVPTKRALELVVPLQEAKKQLERVYAKNVFNIEEAKGIFTIGATDYFEFLLAPKLSEIVAEAAPGITLNFRPTEGWLPKTQLEKGETDLAILVVRETIPPQLKIQELFRDPYICAARKGHPLLKGKVTIDRFVEYGHVLINPQGTLWSITDERLAKLGKPRRLILGTPNALSAAAAVARSNLLITATQKFLDAAMEFMPLELFKGPLELDPIRIVQVWHERSHTDPVHLWMRQKIRAILKD